MKSYIFLCKTKHNRHYICSNGTESYEEFKARVQDAVNKYGWWDGEIYELGNKLAEIFEAK